MKTTAEGIFKPDDPGYRPKSTAVKEKERVDLDTLYEKTFHMKPTALYHVYKRRELKNNDPRQAHTSVRDRRKKTGLSQSMDNSPVAAFSP